jgi:deoxyribodipyrimidine photo-lyase
MRFVGGESEGLKRLNEYTWKGRNILTYKETRNGLLGKDYSSKFSPWLANGSLSVRRIIAEINRFEKKVKKNQSTYWLKFELLWREYFRLIALKYGKRIFEKAGIRGNVQTYNNNMGLFNKWKNGETGNDFVDANMKELLLTGFMSNRGRQNAASYLCKDLNVDWRWGASWFESSLIDYDVYSNWCNWMYVAGVGNDPRENRHFNTKKQAEIYDPNSRYRKTWLSRVS